MLTCTEQGVVAIQRISCQDDDEDMGVSAGGDEDMGVSTSNQSGSDAMVWSVTDSGCILCLRVDGSERYAVFGGYVSVFPCHVFADFLASVGYWQVVMPSP